MNGKPDRILALDLATATGFAYGPAGDRKKIIAGTIRLAGATEITQAIRLRMDRRSDPRVRTLFNWLQTITAEQGPFARVVFEDVEFASSTYQTQLWSALRAAVWLSFPPEIVDCVPVGTLKKFATGAGNATKDQMAAALARRLPAEFALEKKARVWSKNHNTELDDNAVDALWLHAWAAQMFFQRPL